jgi:hypothetical protein
MSEPQFAARENRSRICKHQRPDEPGRRLLRQTKPGIRAHTGFRRRALALNILIWLAFNLIHSDQTLWLLKIMVNPEKDYLANPHGHYLNLNRVHNRQMMHVVGSSGESTVYRVGKTDWSQSQQRPVQGRLFADRLGEGQVQVR